MAYQNNGLSYRAGIKSEADLAPFFNQNINYDFLNTTFKKLTNHQSLDDFKPFNFIQTRNTRQKKLLIAI